MTARNEGTRFWRRTAPVLLVLAVATAAIERAQAEERTFYVILAHSPKSFMDENGNGREPPDGLVPKETVNEQYFKRADSFAEYWEEISYGAVTVAGDVTQWISLPWRIEPDEETGDPGDFINIRVERASACTPPSPYIERFIPEPYGYGAGELFCDCMVLPNGDTNTTITPGKCGALIICDINGDPDG